MTNTLNGHAYIICKDTNRSTIPVSPNSSEMNSNGYEDHGIICTGNGGTMYIPNKGSMPIVQSVASNTWAPIMTSSYVNYAKILRVYSDNGNLLYLGD